MTLLRKYGWLDTAWVSDGSPTVWERRWVVFTCSEVQVSTDERASTPTVIPMASIISMAPDASRLPVVIDPDGDEDVYVFGIEYRDGNRAVRWLLLSAQSDEERARWVAFAAPRLPCISPSSRAQLMQYAASDADIKKSPRSAADGVRTGPNGIIVKKGSEPITVPTRRGWVPHAASGEGRVDESHRVAQLVEVLDHYRRLLHGRITKEGLQDLLRKDGEAVDNLRMFDPRDPDGLLKELSLVQQQRDILRKEVHNLRQAKEELEEALKHERDKVYLMQCTVDRTVKELDEVKEALRRTEAHTPPPIATQPTTPRRGSSASSTSPRSRRGSPAVTPRSSPRASIPIPPPSPDDGPEPQPIPFRYPSRSSSPPSTLACHVCGNLVGATLLPNHIPRCLKRWHRLQKSIPPSCRRLRPPSAPQLPVTAGEAYSHAALNIYLTQSKNRCPRCLNRFDPSVVVEHFATCRSVQ